MSTGTTTPTIRAQFTPESIATLHAAERILAEISYTAANHRDESEVWRDHRVIVTAEFAQTAVSRLIIAANVYYDLDLEDPS
jgi:hypothetical protein